MATKVTSSLINSVSASQIQAGGATTGQVLTYNGSTSTWVASAAPVTLTSKIYKLMEYNQYSGGLATAEAIAFIDVDRNVRVIGAQHDNRFGSLAVYGPSASIMSLPVGEQASKVYLTVRNCVVLTTSGKVYVSGNNSEGECGNGTTNATSTLTQCVNLPTTVTDIIINNDDDVSGGHTMYALTSDGKVYAWGYNGYGCIGDGTTIQKTTPVLVLGPGNSYGNPTTTVLQVISIGGWDGASTPVTTAVLLSDGTVWCAGRGGEGQMGNGSTADSNSTFVRAETSSGVALANITRIGAAGYDNYTSFYALNTSGEMYAWGHNIQGELGLGNNTSIISRPTKMLTTNMTPSTVVVDFYTSSNVTNGGAIFVKTADGKIYTCGDNVTGLQGLGDTTDRNILTNVSVLNGVGVSYIRLNNTDAPHTIAVCLSSTQQIYAAGKNTDGQLGLGHTTTPITTFTGVRFYAAEGIKNVIPIHTRTIGGFTLVLTNNNELYIAGQSHYGIHSVIDTNVLNFKKITNNITG